MHRPPIAFFPVEHRPAVIAFGDLMSLDVSWDLSYRETARQIGMMFRIGLRVVLDPGSPADSLARREYRGLIAAGLDLADERVQENILAFLIAYIAVPRARLNGEDVPGLLNV